MLDEIEFYQDGLKVKNIAFYDDALLANPKFEAIQDEIIRRGTRLNFHTPNGLHSRFITEELAQKLERANFRRWVFLKKLDLRMRSSIAI